MPEPLFAERTRDDSAVARPGESTYRFLDRVDDSAFANVRRLLNGWFARFAAAQDRDAVADLRGRMSAKADVQFYGAFWELYLHELHLKLGFKIEVHPSGPKTTRPDFLISRGDHRFYLEAIVPNPSAANPTLAPGAATVIDYVNAAFSPDFSVGVRYATGQDLPRRKAVISAVEGWLAGLRWSDWRDEESLRYPMPETELEVGSWEIGLQGIARSSAHRGDRNYPTVTVYPGFSAFVEAGIAATVPALDEKASKYGTLDAPYVIAAWVMSPLASERSLPIALFGAEVPLGPGVHPLDLPGPDHRRGLWTPDRQGRQRPSALLFAGSWDFNYNAVARALPRLWLNPWAESPLDVALPFATSRVSGDERSIDNTVATVTASELFDLDPSWPGVPFNG